MSILGKYISKENEQETNYKVPAVFKNTNEDFSLSKAVMVSTAIHPLVVLLIWLFIFIAGLFGITFVLFNKPDTRTRDIEFVLVDKEATPINKNTKYRSDKNSRAGGIHDPKRKVSVPKQSGGGSQPQKKKEQPKQPQAVKPKTTQPKQAPSKSVNTAPKTNTTSEQSAPAKAEAPTPAPRPGITPSAPKISEKPKTDVFIPVPKTDIPNIGIPMGSGPVAKPDGSATGSNGTGVANGGSEVGSGLNFAPSTGGAGKSAISGSGKGLGYGTGNSTGSGTSNGNVGNPGPGNPNGRPGIDAIREPDFGPYMHDLQQRIKRNWDPPKGEESRRVVLLFTIARDGRLMNVKVKQPSGMASADKAATAAVQISAPFKPLPAEYKKDSVEIEFTFDYNVFAAKRY